MASSNVLTEYLAPFKDAWLAYNVETDARTVRRWRTGKHFPKRGKWQLLAFHINRPVADIEHAYAEWRTRNGDAGLDECTPGGGGE
jgi:hypothetical protein